MTELHVPPADLIEAIREALHQADRLSPDPAIAAEQITYSDAFQHYLGTLRATDATGNAQDTHEARDPLRVVCTVTVPLSSPQAAADALSRVPINANVKYDDKPQGILAGIFGVGALTASWTEER